MKKPPGLGAFLAALLLAALGMTPSVAAYAAEGPVVLLTLDGAVSPATADYAVRGIRKAADLKAQLVVIQIDTPGGLDTSMRVLIKEMLSSPVPVAAFVAPSGARAASAGTFILYASHIAAMAPATNLGAATPVQIGGQQDDGDSKPAGKEGKTAKKGERGGAKNALTAKQVEDAAAYIRSLAQLRGRNAKWGEQAVRDAVSLSATDALKEKVIDLVAQDVPELLKKLEGRTVTVQGVARKLQTAGAATVAIEPDWRTRLLAVIANPSVAVILMMIGIYGLIFEFSNPGFVVPGVVGAMCILLAFYAFQLLPVNYAGVALILLGLALLVAEAFAPSFGALGIGGVAALTFGLVVFVDPETAGGYAPSLTFIAGLAAVTSAIMLATVLFALRARRRPVVSGIESLLGTRAEVLSDFEGEGWVRVRGESWRALAPGPLAAGRKVRVTGIDGLTLKVEPEPTQGENQ
ncbi:MAG TPA: nodulation protein NfeD [Burkholderiales bacterium]|nr:nodulation protein NfeD [Burkholderiales bacterium]